MKMKNKLYCHHKSKLALRLRNFAFVSLGIFVVSLAVVIPTYLSVASDKGVPTLASENEEVENVPEVVEEDTLEHF